MIQWMNLKSDFYNKIIENYENCKLKNLKKMKNDKYNNWDELMNENKW